MNNKHDFKCYYEQLKLNIWIVNDMFVVKQIENRKRTENELSCKVICDTREGLIVKPYNKNINFDNPFIINPCIESGYRKRKQLTVELMGQLMDYEFVQNLPQSDLALSIIKATKWSFRYKGCLIVVIQCQRNGIVIHPHHGMMYFGDLYLTTNSDIEAFDVFYQWYMIKKEERAL